MTGVMSWLEPAARTETMMRSSASVEMDRRRIFNLTVHKGPLAAEEALSWVMSGCG